MTEADYKREIREKIKDRGGKCVPIITGEMTEKGTPDIIGCMHGMAFVIEAKLDYNEPSKIQEQRLKEWANAGAIVLIVYMNRHLPKYIAEFLEHESQINLPGYCIFRPPGRDHQRPA